MVSLNRAKYLVLGLQATLITKVEFDPQMGVVCSLRKIAVSYRTILYMNYCCILHVVFCI